MAQDNFLHDYLNIEDDDLESDQTFLERLSKGADRNKRLRLGESNDGRQETKSPSDSEVDDDSHAVHPNCTSPRDHEAVPEHLITHGEHKESQTKSLREQGTKTTGSVNTSRLPRSDKQTTRPTLGTHKSGVVYLSRVPPFMKPQKLRSLLEPHGKINRLYLVPEDAAVRKARLRNGGNKKVTYVEGWVEFAHKTDAKKACELLNARPIGGKKGNFYHDDIWTLLYLRGFKWHHLTEQMDSENKERENRMRAELEKSRREDDAFVENVEKANMIRNMDKKRKRDGDQTSRGSWGPENETTGSCQKIPQPMSQTVLGKIL